MSLFVNPLMWWSDFLFDAWLETWMGEVLFGDDLMGGIHDFSDGEVCGVEFGGVHRDGCMVMTDQEENDSQSLRHNPGGVSYGRSPILGCLTLVCRSRCWGTVHFVGWPDDEIVRIAMSLECMRWGVKRGM